MTKEKKQQKTGTALHKYPFPPVIGPRLKPLLYFVFILFGLLSVNSVYLVSITIIEYFSQHIYQNYFYQMMFLVHLVLGLLIFCPVIIFGAAHMKNAWPRPNYRAVRAGLSLYITILLLLFSGIILTRFDFFQVFDPEIRRVAYWLHVITPLLVFWLFVLHRLAGRKIKWRLARLWSISALVFVFIALIVGVLNRQAMSSSEELAEEKAFFPALAQISNAKKIPAKALMMDQYCQKCHADTHLQWSQSAHRFSSFNNPAYRFSVLEAREFSLKRDGNVHLARFCAGCHDPVPLFSGAFDDPAFGDLKDPQANAGITCTACHSITQVNSRLGNADYTIEQAVHYPFAFSENSFLSWLNLQLIKAKPDFHKKSFLKPIHKKPEFCSSCHKVHIPKELNAYKWLRGQNHFDAYELSGVSGHGASSFYYPKKAKHKCADCHMPLELSNDFGAAHFTSLSSLTVHNHLFPAANTALPYMRSAPEWVNETQQSFLKGALRVDIFGIKKGLDINSPLIAPLRPDMPILEAGKAYILETVIRNLKTGHLFTQGTADSNEVWLDVILRSGNKIIGRSGALSANGTVDPWGHFINAYVLDRNGNRIDRRNAQDIYTSLYNHQIPPGATDVVHYQFKVPEDSKNDITVEVSLKYRKFDTQYMQYIYAEDFVHNDLPITTISFDRLVFTVRGGEGSASQDRQGDVQTPAWERWNDYGIALFRKGGRGEMRQAENAFLQVEQQGRADGAVNLARVFLKEGRLDDASSALLRAGKMSSPAAYPWLITWFTGLVNKQNGHLDAAIENFKHILNTDFAEARKREFDFSHDYRVINMLGQTLFERSKQERGSERVKQRELFLQESLQWFSKTIELDPENTTAHYNLSLIYAVLNNKPAAQLHRDLHAKYRADDNSQDNALLIHRRNNPAADHAANAVVIYDLQRK